MKSFYQNHVLTSITVIVVILLGLYSFLTMPRDKSPAVSFHWVVVQTLYPGATAASIESSITNPIEAELKSIEDIKFTISTSRENVSDILVRFADISEKRYKHHLNELKNKLSTVSYTLPSQAKKPNIIEINSANTFASATLMLSTDSYSDDFLKITKHITQQIKQIPHVYQANVIGEVEKVKDILLDLPSLYEKGLTPLQFEGLLRQRLEDNVIGPLLIEDKQSTLQFHNPFLSFNIDKMSIPTKEGLTEITDLASIRTSYASSPLKAGIGDQSGYLISVMKMPEANLLELLNLLKKLIADEQNQMPDGIQLQLVDDQSYSTHDALQVMYNNAIIGLGLVLLVAGLMIGWRFALIMCIAIPVVFSATLLCLKLTNQTLNITVLLGFVVVLGMVVDDSVVILEAIHHQLKRGQSTIDSIINGIKEIISPVTTTVLTTIATFLPLLLLPGILGQFMFVLPLVVTFALIFSLIEGLFLMPAHIYNFDKSFKQKPISTKRTTNRLITRIYLRSLIKVVRKPTYLFVIILLLILSLSGLIYTKQIKIDFFSLEPAKLFFIDVQFAPNTPDDVVWTQTKAVVSKLDDILTNDDYKAVHYTGIQFGPTGVEYASHLSQVFVSLRGHYNLKSLNQKIEHIKKQLKFESAQLSFRVVNDGPPLSDTLDVKLTGDNLETLHKAKQILHENLKAHTSMRALKTLTDDLRLNANITLDYNKILNSGLQPDQVLNLIQKSTSPTTIKTIDNDGLPVSIRIGVDTKTLSNPFDEIFLASNDNLVKLKDLFKIHLISDYEAIKHFQYHRSVELSFEYDKESLNAVSASKLINDKWAQIQGDYPNVRLSFHGLLDDILETLKYMPWVILLSLGLVYWILGTQFKSFTQPLMIFITTPLAIIGVLIGLWLSGYPLSIYAMYGTIALIGIAVNAAILLISAANQRTALGFNKVNAMMYAAKRRIIPILISTITTMAGLSSLCFGWGGESLLWGPVAASIVYGLGISTLLTLYCIPILFIGRKKNLHSF